MKRIPVDAHYLGVYTIRLILDIKTKGIGSDVLELLQREGMLECFSTQKSNAGQRLCREPNDYIV